MKTMVKVGILAVGAAALALAAPQYAKRAYHSVQKVADTATRTDGAAGAKPLDPKSIPSTVIGMNLGVISFYSSEEPFFDPIKMHGRLTVGAPGQDVALTDQFKNDANGWVYGVPKDTGFIISLGNATGLAAPLECEMSPGWRLEYHGMGRFEGGSPRFSITMPNEPRHDGIFFRLFANKDNTDLTKLQCHVRGNADSETFRPAFMADMKPFRILRFVNWMMANDSPPGKWADRPSPQSRTYAEKGGVPVEVMVALANANHSAAWFTLPFHADEDYQRRFATYVRDHLDSDLKVYAEYSNEVWNGGFPQAKEAAAIGKQFYPAADEAAQNDYVYADRVRAMMAIWNDVFAGQMHRLVRVAAIQPGWAQRAENVLGHKQTWKTVDALAIAPYFGTVPNEAHGTGKARVDDILARVPHYIDETLGWAHTDKTVANRYGLRLIAYEGGPGYNAFEPKMVEDVNALYHDPRFGTLYTKFLERWRTEIGGEFVVYNYAGNGFWSHLDYTGQSWSEAPKMKAVTDFITTLPPAK